jgi:ketosteroid isomerase-like protein
MSTTNMIGSSESSTTCELRRAVEERGGLSGDESGERNRPQQILQLAFDALSQGRISEVVEQFEEDGCFRFSDRALTLEFTEKARLSEFFEKSRELFPDTALEVISLFEDGDHAIAQWKLSATQIVPYGAISYRFPIFLFGATIVRVEKGKIIQWSDYYDQSSSRRMSLGAFFTDWIEY